MKEEDLATTIALCDECFEEKTSLEYATRIFNENKNDPNQIYIVGEADGKIIAHAKVQIVPTIYEHMNTYAILNHICVKPEYRRAHIGTKLLDACFAVAKVRHCKTVDLWSKNFRVAAHAMYHKYGFEVVEAKFFEKPIEGGNHEN
jgi:ribosomal protein S18 acetylase RimI-like enzyme